MPSQSFVRKIFLRILTALLLAAGFFISLNFGYFWQNLKYVFYRPAADSQMDSTKNPEQTLTLEPNTLLIESLEIKVPVIYVEEKSEKLYQQALQKGVVHYPGTANPGEYGNVYIFGHSSDNPWTKGNYKTVFAVLPRIEKGAKILLSDARGKAFVYKVMDSFVANPGDIRWLSQENYQKKLLTLQTSYPIGTSLKRFLVRAELFEGGSENP